MIWAPSEKSDKFGPGIALLKQSGGSEVFKMFLSQFVSELYGVLVQNAICGPLWPLKTGKDNIQKTRKSHYKSLLEFQPVLHEKVKWEN